MHWFQLVASAYIVTMVVGLVRGFEQHKWVDAFIVVGVAALLLKIGACLAEVVG